MKPQTDRYKWYILSLAFLTDMMVVAMPTMGLAVLSREISTDLSLNLVQFGVIWGISAVPSIVTSLLGGSLGDHLGAKRVLTLSALLAGLLVAARSLAGDFTSMALIVLLGGALAPFVTMNAIKAAGQWFPRHQLGLANGALGMGMALGFMLGTLLSDSFFSPLVGGWRNVFLLYGLVGAAFAIPWHLAKNPPPAMSADSQPLSMRRSIQQVARIKNTWRMGFLMLGVAGCVQGVLGYLPLYLRNLGWAAPHADQTVSAFHFISMLLVLPIAMGSDRFASRKHLLVFSSLMIILGTVLLGVGKGGLILPAVLVAGSVRDSFMSILFASTLELDGIGPALTGTAVGFITGIGSIGSVLAPPLGNSLVKISPSAPFFFWAFLALMGLVSLLQVKPGRRPAPGLSLQPEK